MSQWQPIETAPKGKPVLVPVKWELGYEVRIAIWDEGGFELYGTGDWEDLIDPQPAHWMPLPEPPNDRD